MDEPISGPWAWGGFLFFVAAMLALDLGVFHRKAHAVSRREALLWSITWAALALAFGGLVLLLSGPESAQEYLAAWAIEKSLSVDNLFVILVIFTALRIPAELQHRVLFVGIASALVLRAGMIVGGTALLARFHWLVYPLGGLLAATGVRLFRSRNAVPDPDGPGALRWLRRVLPCTQRLQGNRLVVREDGRRVATPLLLSLMAVELSDVAFAVDSIPAVLAVTEDRFIVFTSNAFALLGLRSLFFLLSGLLERFRHLRAGLSAVLVFVGAKMAATPFVKLPAAASLGVILLLLLSSMAWSLLDRPRGPSAASGRSLREPAART
jgi:tellurite resistance protein TerC